MNVTRLFIWIALACCQATAAHAEAGRLEFTRMVAHWADYGRPDYVEFIEEARPELVQVGFYGAHFWSLVHTPEFGGYPAHLPVRGIDECSKWLQALNRRLHKAGVKVVGHFNVEFLVGDPDSPHGPRGFFRLYRELWDESVLGPRPVADPTELLEKDRSGKPLSEKQYGVGGMGEYWACLRNPNWQQVLKAWIRRGIELGVDGYIANYFYRHDCTCNHCQRDFRAYLKTRFGPAELKALGINDIDHHQFDEIIAWHDPADSSRLRREMLRFSQISNKQVFDELFVKYGRSIKPDLIVAQWNHLADFSQVSGDERCLLPAELWGRGEDYLWYSLGGAANYTDLASGFLGEGTLQARYIRGAFDDKPFTLGKYEATRIRVAIAELAANGGAPMGFYTNFTDPAARQTIVQYYQFLSRHDAIFRADRPHAEALLIFPRKAVHEGNLEPLEQFRAAGRALLEAHVLFDVLPDDLATQDRLARYAKVMSPGDDAAKWLSEFKPSSRFEAPRTIRVSASRPDRDEQELDIHFVNYNRTEPPRDGDRPAAGSGIRDEKPIAATGVRVDFRLPAGRSIRSIEVISPEFTEPAAIEFKQMDGRVTFTMPEFLVYTVARLHLKK